MLYMLLYAMIKLKAFTSVLLQILQKKNSKLIYPH